jgi:hypothetical protein
MWFIAPFPLTFAQFFTSIKLAFSRVGLVAKITEGVVEELTDPLRFFIGAVLIVCSSRRDTFAAFRLGAAFVVVLVAAAIPVSGVWVTGTGKPLVYAVAAFLAGMVTLVPDRVAELRGQMLSGGYTKGSPDVTYVDRRRHKL